METLAALVARDRSVEGPALRVETAIGAPHDYRRLTTRARKTGNYLRHFGVREGSTVGVVGEPAAQPVLALLGTALLGGIVRIDPPDDAEPQVLIGPTDAVDPERSEGWAAVPPERRIGYGDEPDHPGVGNFESGAWSENPGFPPVDRTPDEPVLSDGDRTWSHGELLELADEVVETLALQAGESVALRAPLSDPRAIAAGVVAPLSVGAEIVLAPGEEPFDAAVAADAATEVPEERVVAVEELVG